MQASQIPVKFTIPFANSASGSYINSPIPTNSQIGITNGAASLTDGFPPLTFIPTGAGGTPPFGADFNGILNQISAWARWMGAGGPVKYDAAFQSAIGGYPQGAIVMSGTTVALYWVSLVDNNTSDPDTGGANWQSTTYGLAPLASPALTGTPTAPTLSSGDNSTKIATTAFVKNQAQQFSSLTDLSSATTLTYANAGGLISLNGTGAFTVTMPLSTAMQDSDQPITFWCRGAGPFTISFGSEFVYTGIAEGSYTSSVVLNQGDTFTCLVQSSGNWYGIAGSIQLANSAAIKTAIGCTQGAFKNLKVVNGATPTTQVTITADELTLENPSNNYLTARSFSLTATISVSGNNGLDTGTIAANTWYSVWIISNGSGFAALLSLSATSPTMPTGSTYKARVGWVRTNSSSQLHQTLQYGRVAQYTEQWPYMFSQIAFGTSAVSVSNFVPTTASRLIGTLQFQPSTTSNTLLTVGPNATNNDVAGFQGIDTWSANGEFSILLESTNFYVVNNGGSSINSGGCVGWEDNI